MAIRTYAMAIHGGGCWLMLLGLLCSAASTDAYHTHFLCNSEFEGYIYVDVWFFPSSVNTLVGSTAEFHCHIQTTSYNCSSILWRINGSEYSNSTDILHILLSERGIDITTDQYSYSNGIFCDSLLYSLLTIPATIANNNTLIECRISSINFLETDCTSSYYPFNATLLVQGPLAAPGNVQATELSSTTLQLSWEAPFTLQGVPIQYYTVSINDFLSSVHVENVSAFSTQYLIPFDVSKFCGCIELTVIAWNDFEGEPATALYKREVLVATGVEVPTDVPGVLCASCYFCESAPPALQICNVAVLADNSQTEFRFNISQHPFKSQGSIFSECIEQLETDTYTIHFQEIGCGGRIWGDRVTTYTAVSVQAKTTGYTIKVSTDKFWDSAGIRTRDLPNASNNCDTGALPGWYLAVAAVPGMCLGVFVMAIIVMVFWKKKEDTARADDNPGILPATTARDGPPKENTPENDDNMYEAIELTPFQGCIYESCRVREYYA